MTKAMTDEGSVDGPRSWTGPVRVEREDDGRHDKAVEGAAATEKSGTTRSAPPAKVPSRVVRVSGSPSASVKALQVMLGDFGYYTAKVTGFYGTETRNAVSDLQLALLGHGYYFGRPHGSFDEPTRQALERDPAFNTIS